MASKYEKMNLLKNLPFSDEEIEKSEKRNKKSRLDFHLNYHFLIKKPKELTIKQLSDILPFSPKKPKRSKRLTKHKIIQNILPFLIVLEFQEEKEHIKVTQKLMMLKL